MPVAAPLSDIRILDFSRVLAGPYCTALLADLGAEVIKVEPPGGDDYRHVGPFKEGESALFLLVNRGKRSIRLDLKTPDGLRIAQDLAAKADVVVENFRPGVAQRLGIDYPTLAARNPSLVYASISGFGQDGPMSRAPAYDIIAQALSGIMSVTGDPEGPPTLIGEPVADLAAGLFASWGILAALVERGKTGRGRHLDIALLDSLFSLLPTALCQSLYTDRAPQRVGNRHPLSAPFGVFATADGHVAIAVLNDRLFAALAHVVEQPDLVTDPRYGSDSDRVAHEADLRASIETWTRRRSSEAVVDALGKAGVPVAPLWTVPQALDSQHVRHRGLIHPVQHHGLGEIPVPRQPVRFDDAPTACVTTGAPGLGADTRDILHRDLGLDEKTLDDLAARDVI
ncbi:CaiB/BaiF CoA-transferase family protein [Telmatospirillum sp. J64-1]|uniref:CaiB/BaiF CoA transferase family protein n=1 Tax=Telmatospirillum sp. J64-1 TaxID=2502183 RepID=UPI00115D2263|nr:CoA transferase [Telmatospirillum sp. J64-1]